MIPIDFIAVFRAAWHGLDVVCTEASGDIPALLLGRVGGGAFDLVLFLLVDLISADVAVDVSVGVGGQRAGSSA